MLRKIILVLGLIATLSFVPAAAVEEKPVKAEIVYKQVGDRIVEVIRIKTNTGKVYEIYPGIAPKQVPRVSSKTKLNKSEGILFFTIIFLIGISIAWVIVERKYKKEI
jgi:hypothetical protein